MASNNDNMDQVTPEVPTLEAEAPLTPEITDWKALNLSQEMLDILEKKGFTRPTQVQADAVPTAINGQDMIVSAPTGSGKTVCFTVPLMEKVRGKNGTFGLILCPTREIALQIQENLEILAHPQGITSAALIGGVNIHYDNLALASYPNILVGTPGRICDHLERGNLWLEFVEMVVLDEADRMLDMGFSKQLDQIMRETPKTRQTLLFSATIPPQVDHLAKTILRNPKTISVGRKLSAAKSIEQELIWVNDRSKKHELIKLIESEPGTIIVFTRTKEGADKLWTSIHAAGIHDSTYISSSKKQSYREEALEGFRDGKYRVMVATDVAGRGIHIDNVARVINFDLPMEPEDYIHRIGRTGRNEAEGKATTFVTPHDRLALKRIEKIIGHPIPARAAPDYNPHERVSSGGGGRGGRGRGGGGGRSSNHRKRRERHG